MKYTVNRTAAAFDWDDVGEYVQNLLSKVQRGSLLTQDEADVVKQVPDEVIDSAEEKIVSEGPVPDTPKVQVVEKPNEETEKLTPEQIEEVVEESPEAEVLNTFFPTIFNDDLFFNEADPKFMDGSYAVFEYLKAFGYKSGMWVIGPEHKALLVPDNKQKDYCRPIIDGIPICDYLHSQDLLIDDVIKRANSHAAEHGYFPPKGIVAQTHPGCKCYMLCWAPMRVDEIPDTAPGVPVFGDEEEKREYKTRILQNLKNFPVDRWTLLSPIIYEEAATTEGHIIDEYDIANSEYDYDIDNIENDLYGRKQAGSKWKDNVVPVYVSTNFVFKYTPGFVRPIPTTYKGFQVTTNEEYSRIFLVDLNRYIYAPSTSIKELKLKDSNKELYSGDYVKVNGELGIAVTSRSDGSILCFLPRHNKVVSVKSVSALEVI